MICDNSNSNFRIILGQLHKVPEELAHRTTGQTSAEEPTRMRPTRGHPNVCHQAIGNRKVLQRGSAKNILRVFEQKDSKHPRNQNGRCRREVVRAFPIIFIHIAKNNCGDFQSLERFCLSFPLNPKSFLKLANDSLNIAFRAK